MTIDEARYLLERLGNFGPVNPLLTPGPTRAPTLTPSVTPAYPSQTPTPDLNPWPGPYIPYPSPILDAESAVDIAIMYLDPDISVTETVARLVTHALRDDRFDPGMRRGTVDSSPLWVVGLRSDDITPEAALRSLDPWLLSALSATPDELSFWLEELTGIDGLYLDMDANSGQLVGRGWLLEGEPDGDSNMERTFAQIRALPNMHLPIAPATEPPMAPTVDPESYDDDDPFRPTP